MKILPFLVLTMVTGLLGNPSSDKSGIHHHQRNQPSDPNSERASRLLYSPRSRSLSNNNVLDMHTALRRYRESQQTAINDRQSHSTNVNHMDHQNDVDLLNETQNSDDEERSRKELCHARILQKCGSPVIEGFAEKNLPMYQKCRIRENFLHCVIKMKRRACHRRSREDLLLTEDYIRSLRQQILTLLWSARGCVLGMQASI